MGQVLDLGVLGYPITYLSVHVTRNEGALRGLQWALTYVPQ